MSASLKRHWKATGVAEDTATERTGLWPRKAEASAGMLVLVRTGGFPALTRTAAHTITQKKQVIRLKQPEVKTVIFMACKYKVTPFNNPNNSNY